MNKAGLLDWQPAAVETLLSAQCRHGGALDGSDMGVGKTAHALAVVRHLKLPTLVVCPAVSTSSWNRMGEHLGVKFSILNYEMLRTGRTPFGTWEKPRPKAVEKTFVCDSCQQKFKTTLEISQRRCPHQALGIHCIKIVSKPHNYGKFIWNSNIKQLVFDEVHRCGALDSLQCDMLIASKRQRIQTLGLSATPAENPLDFRALGYVLGLHGLVDTPSGPGFFKWAFARGVRKFPLGGFHWPVGEARQKEIMAELHAEIFPDRGVRVRIDDLGTQFPEVQVTSELYDCEAGGKINELYSEMDSAICSLNEARKLDVAAEHPLTKLLRARQEIELLTVPVYEQLVGDAVAQGLSVAVFVNFRQTVKELCKRLKTECRVDGSQTGERGNREREKNVEDFQADRNPVILLTSAAGGISISLHDVLGNRPRLGLVAPGVSAVQFKQVFGRLRRATGKSKALYRIVLIAGTVQEKLHRVMSTKLNNLDAFNDGDLWAANLPLTVGRMSDIFPGE